MNIHKFVVTNTKKADAIVNGDRSFDLSGVDANIKVGDFIHYKYLQGNECARHDITDRIYTVTYIHCLPDSAIVNIKDTMAWVTYIREKIEESYREHKKCRVVLYGGYHYDSYDVIDYDSDSVTLQDKNVKVWKDIHDIADIEIF